MKLNIYTHAKQSKVLHDTKPEIFVSSHHFKTDQWDTYLLLQTTEVEVPDIDINIKTFTIAQIEQLQEEIKVEKAESYLRITKMEETIQSLMCLEQK